MKPRATTLSQRFGFKDPDLKTQSHDEIILSLLDKDKLMKILLETTLKESIIVTSTHITCVHRRYSSHEWVCYQGGHKCPFFHENWREQVDQCPIKDEVLADFNICRSIEKKELLKNSVEIITEYVITNEHNNFVIGFIDIVVRFSRVLFEGKFFNVQAKEKVSDHYIEVKTIVVSFGETMRQINMYREFVNGPFLLITKSRGLKSAFSSQGIFVYEWGLED